MAFAIPSLAHANMSKHLSHRLRENCTLPTRREDSPNQTRSRRPQQPKNLPSCKACHHAFARASLPSLPHLTAPNQTLTAVTPCI
ncbi:uncharacterized protein BKA78DRAFT_306299, partial [Phyllosticta capitalensis]|uniref:uncharacterized protein n=1 Tax=Phyllosticta capitalensis TaxID=121624 RepID=UPI0031318786